MADKSLFNEKTVSRLILGVDITSKQKKAVREWSELLESGKLESEKAGYIDFSNTILRDLLGYTPSLKDGFKHEEENIEFLFKNNKGEKIVAFEAKGAKTKDLWASQGRSQKHRETPVDQINDYLYNKKIKYGVLTNYRLFVLFDRNEGSRKYHKINFEDLKNDENKLKEFILMFSKESLIDKDNIKDIKEKSIIEEKEFTKEFYKLYHETRLMMIKEFKENSPDISDDAAIHFAQLFLNRLMFALFAEDTGKIERRVVEERIIKMLDRNQDLFSTQSKFISDLIVTLFNEMDKGNPPEIFGFNGGLFSHPIPPRVFFKDFRDDRFFKGVHQHFKLRKESLNEKEKLIFNKFKNKLNPLIKNILLMASFDFNTEVNVNILGHIFEQSITDLEDLKGDKISRRKKEGIFYTPEYITDYICRNTIIPYLSKKDVNEVSELIKEYENNIGELEEKFKEMKILDPACGSGAFLIKATDIMLEIFKAIQDFKQWKGDYEAERGLKRKGNNKGQLVLTKWDEEAEAREIIENSIHGVDINEESIEITKLSLFLKMARKNRKLTDLSNNIKQGNSLIDDEEVAGKLAFNWNKEFPKIMDKGGFDIVIGNPPYVRADTEDEKFIKQRKYLDNSKDYETLYEKWDLMIPFYERSLKLLKEGGYHSFIVSNAISTSKYAFKLQKWIIRLKIFFQ